MSGSQKTITQVVDDRGPGITFFSASGSWNQETNPLEFNQTATWTQTAEDSLRIFFNGTGISVFGTLDSSGFPPVQTSYELDDPTIPITRVTNSSLVPNIQFQQVFYQSPVLTPGAHTLTVTNLANGSTFRFDFVKVTSPNPAFESAFIPAPPTSTTTTSSSFSGTPTTVASGLDATISTTPANVLSISPFTLADQTPTSTLPSTTSTDLSDSASSTGGQSSSAAASTSGGTGISGTHLAAIVGGILGGLGFIIWIVVFLVIQRKRRQRMNRTRRMGELMRRSFEKRTYQSEFTPVRRHDSQDLSPSGTPESRIANTHTSSDSISRSSTGTPASRYELTPFTDQSTPETVTGPPERSVWSPEPIKGREGKKRAQYYRDSPPKYNSGQFYHLS